jgi:hypothetical protein
VRRNSVASMECARYLLAELFSFSLPNFSFSGVVLIYPARSEIERLADGPHVGQHNFPNGLALSASFSQPSLPSLTHRPPLVCTKTVYFLRYVRAPSRSLEGAAESLLCRCPLSINTVNSVGGPVKFSRVNSICD